MRLDRLFGSDRSVMEEPFLLPCCYPGSNEGNNPLRFQALLNLFPQAKIHPKTALRSTYA